MDAEGFGGVLNCTPTWAFLASLISEWFAAPLGSGRNPEGDAVEEIPGD